MIEGPATSAEGSAPPRRATPLPRPSFHLLAPDFFLALICETARNLSPIEWQTSGEALSNVASPPGCSRKLDLTVDPSTNRNKLKLLATATVAGRKVRDKDNFNFHR